MQTARHSGCPVTPRSCHASPRDAAYRHHVHEAAPSAPTRQVAADEASHGRGWLRGPITPNGQRQVEPESTYAACQR